MKRLFRMKIVVACMVVALLMSCASVPRHPNLDSAQQLVQQAIDSVTAAQKANNYDMKGHAEKAKQLMKEAMAEIQQAEQAADAK